MRFVRFLPDIVRLQRLLMDRFHRRIDRTDAEHYTIRQFLQELPRGICTIYVSSLMFCLLIRFKL